MPSTFTEFTRELITNGLFLGAVVWAIMFGLGWFLANVSPGNGYRLPENWNRLISWLLPFVVALAALQVRIVQGLNEADLEGYYQVFILAGSVAIGKQGAYIAEQAIRSATKPKDPADPGLLPPSGTP